MIPRHGVRRHGSCVHLALREIRAIARGGDAADRGEDASATSATVRSDELGDNGRRVIRLLATFLVVSTAAGVLGAGMLVPAVAVVGGVAEAGVSVFNQLPADLGDQSLPEATKVLYADNSVMATIYDQNRIVVSFDEIAPVMRDAIVSIDDARFYSHGAVDLKGVARALVSNADGGGTQGASTLTQQYVKNVLVEQAVRRGDSQGAAAAATASGAAGYARKLREMKLAVGVEQKMSKDDILTGYLNVAYFNNDVYGIEAAARFYFNVSAKDLTLPQATLLAGLVQNPVAYNPLKYPDAALRRRNVVLDRMQELGRITQQQRSAALTSPLSLSVQHSQRGCLNAGSAAYFCDYVTRLVQTDPVLGTSEQSRSTLLRRGGLTIKTTLDPRVQAITQQAVDHGVHPGQPTRMAASVVQPGTGKILAMAHGHHVLDRYDTGRRDAGELQRRQGLRWWERLPDRFGLQSFYAGAGVESGKLHQ